MHKIWNYVKALARIWWFVVSFFLSLGSTIATYLQSYLTNFAVPKWIPFAMFLVAFFLASYRVYRDVDSEVIKVSKERDGYKEQTDQLQSLLGRHADELATVKQRNQELEEQVKRLRVKPYDEAKRAKGQEILGALFQVNRDLLRYLLENGRVSNHALYGAARVEQSVVTNALRQVEERGLIQREEKIGSGIVHFSINPAWMEVFRDLLYPREEKREPDFA